MLSDHRWINGGRTNADAEHDGVLRRLRERASVADVAIAERLGRLGLTSETVVLIKLIPLLAVAWADGHITGAEREAVISEARSYGIAPESAADLQLAAWLTDAPSEIVRDAAVDILAGSILGDVERVIAACHTLASASGGAFGLQKISAPEQDVLDRITYSLERKGIVSGRRCF